MIGGGGIENRYGILAGALSYDFCYWAILNAARHPYFLNPMIYFPLIILGIEKIIQRKRPYLFILSVAVSAMSNFYFFYMIAILAFAYGCIRLGFLYHQKLRQGLFLLLRLLLFAFVGVGIACVIFLPVFQFFLNDSRGSIERGFRLFYPLSYYSGFLSTLVGKRMTYWLCLGFTAPMVMALLSLFLKPRKSQLLRTLVIASLVMTFFPIFGRLMNGMSYISNRWSWAFALLGAFILAYMWEDLFSLSAKEWRKLAICCALLYVMMLLFDYSRDAATLSTIPLLFVTLILVYEKASFFHGISGKQIAVLGIVAISCINLAFWKYAPSGESYAARGIENKKILESNERNEAGVLAALGDESYPRYTGRYISQNQNMTHHISSTQYYWTLSNPNMNEFRTDMRINEDIFYNYLGYDDRTSLIELSATQFYTTTEGDVTGMPYGYDLYATVDLYSEYRERYLTELAEELGVTELSEVQRQKVEELTTNSNLAIYKNQFALPLGYCYDSYIDRDAWESLDTAQKQQVQLLSVLLEESPDEVIENQGIMETYAIPYERVYEGSEITELADGFITTTANTSVLLTFAGMGNAETYVELEDLDFDATKTYDLYFGDETVDPLDLYNRTNWEFLSEGERHNIRYNRIFADEENSVTLSFDGGLGRGRNLDYLGEQANFTSGRHDFIVNMGYSEEPLTSIRIVFPTAGRYRVDNIRVYCVPMEGYEEKVAALQKDTLQNIVMDTDCVSGTIFLDKPKLLCMAIPYARGWSAVVDGEEKAVLRMNERYFGVELPAGDHSVEFHYSTPYKREGAILSLVSLVIFAGIVVLTERAKRKEKETL